ncbi:MAG: hypothetical protein F6K10_01580 [Moorea sp. SIO2B7]|nr:hypothetical protein [Moorena sp. SIO2B7]
MIKSIFPTPQMYFDTVDSSALQCMKFGKMKIGLAWLSKNFLTYYSLFNAHNHRGLLLYVTFS